MKQSTTFHNYNSAKRYLIQNGKYVDFLREAGSNSQLNLIEYANADIQKINDFDWEAERVRFD